MLRLCCRYPFSLTTSTSPHRTEAQPGPLLPCPRTCVLGGVQQVISKQGRIRSLRDRLEAETRCSLIQSFSLPERTPARTVPSMTTRCCHEQVDGCLVTSLPPLCLVTFSYSWSSSVLEGGFILIILCQNRKNTPQHPLEQELLAAQIEPTDRPPSDKTCIAKHGQQWEGLQLQFWDHPVRSEAVWSSLYSQSQGAPRSCSSTGENWTYTTTSLESLSTSSIWTSSLRMQCECEALLCGLC